MRRGCWTTTDATATAAPRAISTCRRSVSEEALEDALQEQIESDDIYPALVLDVERQGASRSIAKAARLIEIGGDGLQVRARR